MIFSQSSIYLVSTNNAMTSTISVISNGGTFTLTSTASSNDVPAKFRFYNINSTNTYTYNVLRTIKSINTQGVNTATTYFCVGATCLPPSANTLTNPGDYIVLSPGSYEALITYFSELSTIGYSEVYYKIFNVNDPNDTLSFTMAYNPTLSVKENSRLIENVSIFPVPANENVSIQAKVNSPIEVKLTLYNILGQSLFVQKIKLNEGTFKKNIDISTLPDGTYFLNLQNVITGENIFSQKIIVNKP
jgi:hypothetical protein